MPVLTQCGGVARCLKVGTAPVLLATARRVPRYSSSPAALTSRLSAPMTYAALDGELELREASSAGPAALCCRRGSGERVSCAVCDILTATCEGSTLLIHHYPLVQSFGCCTVGAATRCPDLCRVRCASEADARDWVSRTLAALGPRPRRVAVFVNPVGGTGRALSLYNAEVLPLLKLAGVDASLTLTQHRGHATEVAQSLDLTGLDALLVVSGDGLLSEVYNGLMQHSQLEAAARLPIGVIPAGSGNAMATSLAARAGEACSVSNATLAALCCTQPAALDAALVRQADSRPLHALLSLSWALVADIDIESEAMRALGSARFTVQALLRCAMLRHYAGCVMFVPSPDDSKSLAAGRPATDEEASRARRLGGCGGDDSDHWRVLDGPLESVWALNVPYGGEDAHAAPAAVLDDGCFDVVVISGGNALSVASSLIAMEEGEHINHACVTVVKATAFVLEPGDPQSGDGGLLVLDGELAARRKVVTTQQVEQLSLRYAPLHVTVRRGAARVLARPCDQHV